MHSTRSFVHVLTLMFIFLKLTNYIYWSWLGVFAVMIGWYTFAILGAILDVIAENVRKKEAKSFSSRDIDAYLKTLSRNN